MCFKNLPIEFDAHGRAQLRADTWAQPSTPRPLDDTLAQLAAVPTCATSTSIRSPVSPALCHFIPSSTSRAGGWWRLALRPRCFAAMRSF
jgi:hypothetical protein